MERRHRISAPVVWWMKKAHPWLQHTGWMLIQDTLIIPDFIYVKRVFLCHAMMSL